MRDYYKAKMGNGFYPIMEIIILNHVLFIV